MPTLIGIFNSALGDDVARPPVRPFQVYAVNSNTGGLSNVGPGRVLGDGLYLMPIGISRLLVAGSIPNSVFTASTNQVSVDSVDVNRSSFPISSYHNVRPGNFVIRSTLSPDNMTGSNYVFFHESPAECNLDPLLSNTTTGLINDAYQYEEIMLEVNCSDYPLAQHAAHRSARKHLGNYQRFMFGAPTLGLVMKQSTL